MKLLPKLGLAAIVAACLSTNALAAATLDGAGSTAIYPVLSAWADTYKKQTGIAVNYQSIGSGGGIKQIEAGTVDFGASDKPLKHEDLISNNLVQFPQVNIALVPVVHLPGAAQSTLTFDGPTLAGIYLGKITKWNDPAIKRLNPGTSLPNLAIITVHRSDGSGTTFTFTDYLSKVSPDWKTNVGADTSVAWPSGLGGKGNAGVAATVNQTIGSIGYVEYAYAKQNKMNYSDMVNSAGKRVSPSLESFGNAAAFADYSKVQDFNLVVTNEPGAGTWPIAGSTWLILRKDKPTATNHEVLKFSHWALTDTGAQASAKGLDYVPMGDTAIKQIEASWTSQLKAWP